MPNKEVGANEPLAPPQPRATAMSMGSIANRFAIGSAIGARTKEAKGEPMDDTTAAMQKKATGRAAG